MAAHEFIAWALSPDRTLEEAYCAERLVEQGYTQWCIHNKHEYPSYEKKAALANKRRLNPAHRAKLDPTTVARATEKLVTLTYLSIDAHSDRPLRDISALRFFPQVTNLSLYGHEFSDITPLKSLTRLESLHMSSQELEDFTPVAALKTLKSFSVYVHQPWPIITGLEALTELEKFSWHGNLLPLEDIPRFDKLREAKIHHGGMANLPLRNATRLPEMPWLEELELDGVHRLDGITRWPRLRNLTLAGPFKDLRPLTGLRALTHLELHGEMTRDLTPLAQLPELRKLRVRSSHPQDYSVLAEAPKLHQVVADGCKINKLELAALHEALAPWEDEFATAEPRPRGRARFVICEHKNFPKHPRESLGPAARWNDDPKMAASEEEWFARQLTEALSGLLGRKGWGRAWSMCAGSGWININTLEAAEQMAVIVETTRQVLCGTRFPWHVHIAIDLDDPDSDWHDDDDEEETEEQELARELEDIKDYRQRRKEEEEYLEREHRMRLLQQEGKAVNPAEFAVKADNESYDDSAFDDDDEDEDESEPAPLTQAKQELAEKLWVHGVITEEGLFADARGREAAEHLMGRKAEDTAA